MNRHLALDTIACPDCELQQTIPPLPPGASARCARCKATIARNPVDPIDRPLALAVAAAIVFVVANTTPLMGLSAVGREAHRRRSCGGAWEMWSQGSEITAVMVALLRGDRTGKLHRVHADRAARREAAAGAALGRSAAARGDCRAALVDERGHAARHPRRAHQDRAARDGDSPASGCTRWACSSCCSPRSPSTFDPHVIWTRVVWADGTRTQHVPCRASAGAARMTAATHRRRAAGPRVLHDLRAAVAPGASGARQARLPALRRHADGAPPPLDPVHVGARHRRRDPVHPGQCAAGADHDDARLVGVRHDHQRRRLPLRIGIVAARADRAGRERDDPAGQAGRARAIC